MQKTMLGHTMELPNALKGWMYSTEEVTKWPILNHDNHGPEKCRFLHSTDTTR